MAPSAGLLRSAPPPDAEDPVGLARFPSSARRNARLGACAAGRMSHRCGMACADARTGPPADPTARCEGLARQAFGGGYFRLNNNARAAGGA